jgi:hypothetical protein
VEISVSLPNPRKIAAKTEKLAGIYCLSHVYEVDLRGIISMAVPKGTAEERKSQNLGKEVNEYGKVGTLAADHRG